MESIILGGGCFWCIEAIFRELRGVSEVVSGYAGGATENPTYEQVCSGRTGHAEVVKVTFDPTVIMLYDILTIFFTLHDPTTLNRQGADSGTQYRSIILYTNDAQKTEVEDVIGEIGESGIWPDPIVTEVTELEVFYLAEEYHQRYFEQHGTNSYCSIVIAPKVAKLRSLYVQKLKKEDLT